MSDFAAIVIVVAVLFALVLALSLGVIAARSDADSERMSEERKK
jgi:ABC-type proline/glycine betaine transport system permease subunit